VGVFFLKHLNKKTEKDFSPQRRGGAEKKFVCVLRRRRKPKKLCASAVKYFSF